MDVEDFPPRVGHRVKNAWVEGVLYVQRRKWGAGGMGVGIGLWLVAAGCVYGRS